MHLKALTEFYTLISMSLFIDTCFGGNIPKLVDFTRISWVFAYFWKLNLQIFHKLQIESKKQFYIIIEGTKVLQMHLPLNFLLPLEITKFE